MDIRMSEKADYGNWVSDKMLCAGGIVSAAAFGLCAVCPEKAAVALSAVGLTAFALTMYMKKCSDFFDFNKGSMMGKMHNYLLEHLKWEGKGRLLDIGCGAGALTIKCAKFYPDAKLTGVDYWGAEWDYAKEQCEKNAVIEQISDRVAFEKGDVCGEKRRKLCVSGHVCQESALRRYGGICPGTERGGNDRNPLHRQCGEKSGFCASLCTRAVDDKRRRNTLWGKIS